MPRSISVVLVLRHSQRVTVAFPGFTVILNFCSVLFTTMASAIALAPSSVISFLDISNSISVVSVLRHSPKAVAPSSDISLSEMFSFLSVLFTCMAFAIALAPLHFI